MNARGGVFNPGTTGCLSKVNARGGVFNPGTAGCLSKVNARGGVIQIGVQSGVHHDSQNVMLGTL